MKPLYCDNDLFQFRTHFNISNSEKLVMKCYGIQNARDKKDLPGRRVYYGRKYTCCFVGPRLQPSSPTPDSRSITMSLVVVVSSQSQQNSHSTPDRRLTCLRLVYFHCFFRPFVDARVLVVGERGRTMNAQLHAHHVYVVNFTIQRICSENVSPITTG
jgi:hypothetical protein